jgi:IS30 family transposase
VYGYCDYTKTPFTAIHAWCIHKCVHDGIDSEDVERRHKANREISDFFNVSHSTVVRILQRLVQRLSITNAKKGRPRKTSRQDDSMIRRLSVANPFLPVTSINAEMNNRYGINVTNTTVHSRLRASSLLARHAAKKQFTSAKNRVARLAFAREHLNWIVLQ